MRYSIGIDDSACIGSGTCIAEASGAFQFDDRRVAFPTAEAANLSDDDLIRIAQNCPSGAICIYDRDGAVVDVFG
jgi:ferredoxin